MQLAAVLRRRPALVVDTILALLVAAFTQLEVRQPWDDGHRMGALSLNAPLVAMAVLPLALRRTRPTLGLWLMVAALGLPSVVVPHDLLFWGGFVPLVVMVHAVARSSDDLGARCSWLTGPVLWTMLQVHVPELRTLNEIAFDSLTVLVVWASGRLMRRLDRDQQELSAALIELEEQRAVRAAAAVDRERSRIAAEMHDVVSHAVSLMVLQVGAARLQVETTGGAPTASGQLRTAELAGRDALDQLRRSLAVLRGAR